MTPPLSVRWIGDTDAWLLAEGKHLRPWQKLGAHPVTLDGRDGVAFAVWAPNARQVLLLGDFNGWQAQPLALLPGCGVWEVFVPGAAVGHWYKFAVEGADGVWRHKTDPCARETELPPGNAARVCEPLRPPPATGAPAPTDRAPMAIYEVHVGSWRRPGGPHTLPTWDDLARELVPYAAGLGFTHLELLPVSEHPFYGSWGYQPTGLYAPTARYGRPDGFRRFVDAAHAAGLKIILDWVPAHFPADEHALARFDGTALYEHADPREGFHRDWNTLIYNWGRHEVRNYLVGNALFWIEQYGIDGLRVDAVASMLYRDYSRPAGEWVPNKDGGRENYEAIAFLREVHEVLQREAPQAVTIAEESTAFPRVTGAVADGGLGFDHKWNMGWMHDTLAYFAEDPVHRRWHHQRMTFSMMYAWSEDYVLPLSHDEVVHGKGSLLGKMAGDPWQQRANLRALYAWMYAHPGKKLLFMGAELAQPTEWNHDAELPWHLLGDPAHAGVQALVRDLNRLYRERPALHARDTDPHSFQWLVVDDADQSVLAFMRWGHRREDSTVVIANLTPVVREGYRIGLPHEGHWLECLNTDSAHYGGGNVGNGGSLQAEPQALHGQAWSAPLTLPPLGVIWLRPQ
ncbi:1,4-alpha-glucan branching protein GlgB [Hydrogenophaga electricum]|uniref:1,4-alpha-glucan branching enzyme GlgB n=1 Tax=Hydrogenophaga electricum TaxID=1230953 RepID=A0ABQ6C282_9BURK|nr:1,4-alpha-glucan branching protein GlgB [Hydrogenophaga electricum]GLS14107.1 1,4-alpha-glucan branching enzyme GlgB 1 [Hydrogenophaga electricum]